MDPRSEAEAMVLAMEYGALDVAAVNAWADVRIMETPGYDPALIDVSLAGTVAEAITALRAFGPAEDRADVAKRACRFFHAALVAEVGDYRKVARALYAMVMEDCVPSPELAGPMWGFYDDLDLAIDGIYGDTEAVRRKILNFLDTASQ